MPRFTLKIDQLPPESIEADDARDAARKVAKMLDTHESLKRLRDDGPVEIKLPDGTPWGRHLSIAHFRAGAHEAEGIDDVGPQKPATP